METNKNIEEQVNKALESVKGAEPVELSYHFFDKVINKVHAQKPVRSIYTYSPLLKVAAVLGIIVINILTLRLAFSPQPAPSQVQYATIKDFVNEYQINDVNEEMVTFNTPAHE